MEDMHPMSNNRTFVIFCLTLLWYCSSSADIICDAANECKANPALTTCVDSEVCNIICNGTESCYGTTFTCPIGAECNIHCEHPSDVANVCRAVNVIAGGSTKLNLNCIGNHACAYGTSIQCPFTGDCNIQLKGTASLRQCAINASASTGDLNIESAEKNTTMSTFSLYASNIYCPLSGNCNLNVYGDAVDLALANIWATDSDGILNITVSGGQAMLDANVYCPDAYSGTPNCLFRVVQDAYNADNWGMLKTLEIHSNRSFEQVSMDFVGLSDPRWCFSDPNTGYDIILPRMWCEDDSSSCWFIWVNGELQCSYLEETSACNIASPNNVVTGSDFTDLCKGPIFCRSYKFLCDEGSTCDIECGGMNACKDASIQCPTNGACNINATTAVGTLHNAQIDCGVTGDCTLTLSFQYAIGTTTINGASLNGANLNLLDPDLLGGWDGTTIHCPLIGDCNIIGGTAPNAIYSASSETSNVLTVNASRVPNIIHCPAYSNSSAPNCFINIINSAHFVDNWMHSKRIYADGAFAQVMMTFDPSIPHDDTAPTVATHGSTGMWGSGMDSATLTCSTGQCYIDYVNGMFQCRASQVDNGCNVANPDPIIQGSNFTFDVICGAIHKTFQCAPDVDCYIKCNVGQSCIQGTFLCPENALCYMYARDWCAGCYATLKGANYGDIFIDGAGDVPYPNFLFDASHTTGNAILYARETTGRGIFQSSNTHLHCPKDGTCHFQIEGRYSLNWANVYTSRGTFLSINASAQSALAGASIYCPETDYAETPQCVIHVDSQGGTFTQLLDETNIYAVGALANDVLITCDYTSTVDECYTVGSNPNVFCTGDYGSSCNLALINGFSEWECEETGSTCYHYAPQCTFLSGQPCSVSGDPHTITWNGNRHDYQGQPWDGKEQFYYIYPCAEWSTDELPFTVLGRHYQVGSGSVSGLDYITIQLFDDTGDIYYVWLSSAIQSYLNAAAAVNTLYDANTGFTPIVDDTATPIGNRFSITITSSTNPARIDVVLTIDGRCDVNLYMISQGNTVGRDRMHHLQMDPPECYRCFICGLCGDFERPSAGSEWEQMETCDGGFVPYRAGWSATITEAYDVNGWTWERSYVEANCENRTAMPTEPAVYGVSVGDTFTYVSPCDASIESQVISACAAAKTAQSTCCDLIGNGYCDTLQTNCELDVCVAAGTDATAISGHVQSLFTDPVDFVCNLPNVEELYNASNFEAPPDATVPDTPPNCFEIDGGGWTLVRHAYNEWHPATDNLVGTDEYGTYDNHPQSMSSWSIPFSQYLATDGSTEFMFSNGDCSKWLITTNDQFTTGTATAELYNATITSSYTSETPYIVQWFNRQYDPVTFDEDPWISAADHGTDMLYGEAANEFFSYAVAGAFHNVWIRIDPTKQCALDTDYFIEGIPCMVSGDPHFILWNGNNHDFQGQPAAGGKEQFYYIRQCYDADVDLPFNILGRHYRWSASSVSGLDYITLELFDDNGDVYYVWLSSVIGGYADSMVASNTLYDDNTAAAIALTSGVEEPIGNRFKLTATYVTNRVNVVLTIDDVCTVELYMIGTGVWDDTLARHQMHTLQVTPPECYKCLICGLCGDFQRGATGLLYETLETCDGNYVEYRAGWSASITEAYDADGWTWEKAYVDANCVDTTTAPTDTAYTPAEVIDPATIVDPCSDDTLLAAVQTECQTERDANAACCGNIAASICDDLQTFCEVDVCAIVDGDTTAITAAVQSLFAGTLQAVCADEGIFEATLTDPSPNAPPPIRDTCEYDVDYFFEGSDCVVSGDPHFRIWNGEKHDFQGQPNTGKEQFYYVHRCRGTADWNMPFSISGRHYRWSASSVSGLDYITIELLDSNGDEYYVWLSSGIAAYLDAATAANTLYDDNTGTAMDLTSGVEQQIGSRFKITFTQVSSNRIDVVLTVDDECTIELYMKGEAVYDDTLSRYRMHYLQITPPECYKCFTCGLCGDFSTSGTGGVWEQLQTCSGGFIPFRAGWSAAITEAYDPNGLSWEYSFVQANCGNFDIDDGTVTIVPDPYTPLEPTDPIVEPCNDAVIEAAVIAECQTARDAKTACCDTIGGDYCDALQSNCEVDACVAVEGDATAIPVTVAALFTESVDLVCNLPDAAARFDPTKTDPSSNAPGPVRDTCTYDEDYFFEGTSCTVSGDPHFKMWNGDAHDFQGQPNTGKDQFYYVHRCQGTPVWNMPFNILGRHYRWSSSSVSGLDYITFELLDDNGDVYYVWLSSGIAAYLDAATAVNALYDDNSANALTSGVEQQIGNRFKITYTQVSTTHITVVLTVDDECMVELFMKAQAVYDDTLSRYRMHYLQITPPECFKCFICGLCGDFTNKATGGLWEQLQTCNGGFTSYRAGWSSAITEAYDINGWTWEYSFVAANCSIDATVITEDAYTPDIGNIEEEHVDPCAEETVQAAVIAECQSARDSRTACCDTIGGDYCDALQRTCQVDTCAIADGDVTAISDAVAGIFTEPLDVVCNLPDAATIFDPTKTAPSPNAPEPDRDTCTYDLDYFFEGTSCTVSGDPHFRLWNGDNHDFQGQPNTGKEQFYYVHRCDGVEEWNMPFSISGRHYRWSTASVSGLDYITFELLDSDGAEYYVWLSSGIAAYLDAATAANTLYDDNTGAAIDLTSGVEQQIGNRFKMTFTQVSTTQINVVFTVDDECTVELLMRGEYFHAPLGRYSMHYLQITPPECYRCFMCGLCGDFVTSRTGGLWEQLQTCDGKFVSYRAGWSAAITEAYDANGWSWERSYAKTCVDIDGTTPVDPEPAPYTAVEPEEPIVDPCADATLQAAVIAECQSARDANAACCETIGICDELQRNCEVDVCVAVAGNATLIPDAAQAIFADSINLICNLPDAAEVFSYNKTVASPSAPVPEEPTPTYCEAIQTYQGADLIVECLGVVSAESGAVIDSIPLVDHFTIEFLLSMTTLSTNPSVLPITGPGVDAVTITSVTVSAGGTDLTVTAGEAVEFITDPGIGTTVTVTLTYDWDSTTGAALWCPGCIRQFAFKVDGTSSQCVSYHQGTQLTDQTMTVSYVHDGTVRYIRTGGGVEYSCTAAFLASELTRIQGYIYGSALPDLTNVLYFGGHPSVYIFDDGVNWNLQVGINKDGSDSVQTSLSCASQAMAVSSLPVSGVDVLIEVDQNGADGETFIVTVDGNRCTDALVNAPVSFDPAGVYEDISIPSTDRILSGEVIQDLVVTLYDARELRTPCVFGENYWIEGNQAYATGDPHFRMWNGDYHDFQGVASIDAQYYLITRRNGSSTMDLPFNLLLKNYYYTNENAPMRSVEYITFELFDSTGEVYLIYLSYDLLQYSSAMQLSVDQSTLYSDISAQQTLSTFTVGKEVSIGALFSAQVTAQTDDTVHFTLSIGDDCSISLYLTNLGSPNAALNGRYLQNLHVDPPTCYKCHIAGLFGDFVRGPVGTGGWAEGRDAKIPLCGGGYEDIKTGWSIASAQDTAFSENALTWKKDSAVCDRSTAAEDGSLRRRRLSTELMGKPSDFEFVDACDSSIADVTIVECQAARDLFATLCASIEAVCDALQEHCNYDACVSADGDLTAVAGEVEGIFSRVLGFLESIPEIATLYDEADVVAGPGAPTDAPILTTTDVLVTSVYAMSTTEGDGTDAAVQLSLSLKWLCVLPGLMVAHMM